MDGHVLMKRRSRALAVSGVLASTAFLSALIVGGCGSTDCSFTASCPGSGATSPDAGDAGEDAAVVIPATCDLTKSPKDSPDCVVDGVGIFVSAAGKADAKGTKSDPFSTIAAAIIKAVNTKHPRVYICDGKYDEPIKLAAPLSVYGGFDCAWSNTGVKPKITPAKGAAIEIASVTDEVVIQDVDATGLSDAAVKGSSAIGALITKSKVTLRAVAISAGPGQDGAKGVTGSNYSGPTAAVGINASGASGGGEKTCTCTDATQSIGGHGADGTGANFSSGKAVPPIVNTNSGATNFDTCDAGSVGLGGDSDLGGEPIDPPGMIVASGWETSPVGGSGKNGRPGQGGGGGGAKTEFSTAGGGGGCGGCGGAGAAAGTNGGASIGVLSIDSTLLVDAAQVTSASGGKGGAGGDGQPGQEGGTGGGSAACKGGPGGVGAGGSGGAGGAGGDSFAVAWKGATQPSLTATVSTPGTAGNPGAPGGAGPGTKQGNPGKPGKPGRQQAIFTQ